MLYHCRINEASLKSHNEASLKSHNNTYNHDDKIFTNFVQKSIFVERRQVKSRDWEITSRLLSSIQTPRV